ncbi:MAG: cell wall-active antibiotics response protein [Bacteroidales bacterium]|nr:cell wall-active antibiotics response protein [Bacteroidales bacterium]
MTYNCNTNLTPTARAARKLTIGIIILVYGFILLFDNVGLLPPIVKQIFFSWQVILILLGILTVVSHKGSISGIIIIAIGAFFMIPKFINVPFNFTQIFWPFLLILLGFLIIFRRNSNVHHHPHRHNFNDQNYNADYTSQTNMNDYIDVANIFGGNKQIIVSQQFKGGKITCIFGGSELDFTHAQLAEGTHVIDMVCVFGGASLIVPADWEVRTEVVSILGGFADKRHAIPTMHDKNKILIIKGVTFFGGGEIKSYK